METNPAKAKFKDALNHTVKVLYDGMSAITPSPVEYRNTEEFLMDKAEAYAQEKVRNTRYRFTAEDGEVQIFSMNKPLRVAAGVRITMVERIESNGDQE